jgi:hypothetical protein
MSRPFIVSDLLSSSADSPRASQHDFASSFDLDMDPAEIYSAFDPNAVEDIEELGLSPCAPFGSPSCSLKLSPTDHEDSPYPEVRSAVANFDDPEMPASTIRSWTLGLLFSILIPGMNQFFHFRFPCMFFFRPCHLEIHTIQPSILDLSVYLAVQVQR